MLRLLIHDSTQSIKQYMYRKIILSLVLVAFTTVLSAQITRKQADTIAKTYLQSELVGDSLLYVNVNLPSAAGVVITTSNQEIVKAEYACWAYYLKESDLSQCRYLFVNEDNGNVLEVIASNDLGQNDTSQWKLVDEDPPLSLVKWMENGVQLLYPNPTTGQLIVDYGKDATHCVSTSVDIYDEVGKSITNFQFSTFNSQLNIDVSQLSAGMYFLKIDGKMVRFVKE